MRQIEGEFRREAADVFVVTFLDPERTARYRRETAVPFPCLADPERRLYRLLGIERGTPARVFGRAVIAAYVRLLRTGGRLHRPEEDPFQLGGDAVVDPEGRLRWIHRSRSPVDRPTPSAVLDVLRRARRGEPLR